MVPFQKFRNKQVLLALLITDALIKGEEQFPEEVESKVKRKDGRAFLAINSELLAGYFLCKGPNGSYYTCSSEIHLQEFERESVHEDAQLLADLELGEAIAVSFTLKGQPWPAIHAALKALAEKHVDALLIHGFMPRSEVIAKGFSTDVVDAIDTLFPRQAPCFSIMKQVPERDAMVALVKELNAKVYVIGEIKEGVAIEANMYLDAGIEVCEIPLNDKGAPFDEPLASVGEDKSGAVPEKDAHDYPHKETLPTGEGEMIAYETPEETLPAREEHRQ